MDQQTSLLSIAQEMVETAVKRCAVSSHMDDTRLFVEDLRQGKVDRWISFTEDLSAQIAGLLASEFEPIKAIHAYSADPQAMREIKISQAKLPLGINLIISADDPGLAIGSFLGELEASILQSLERFRLDPIITEGFPITWQILDQEAANKGCGQGLLTQSSIIHSNQLWPLSKDKNTAGIQTNIKPQEDSLMDILNTYDPVLASVERSIDHGRSIEKMSPALRSEFEHHLVRLKVGLIRKLISDQLFYINIAKKWFTIDDLAEIHRRTIGYGKIGGKAAGMLLAARIINEVGDEEVNAALQLPESYFLGSDLIYIFMAMNGLMHWEDQKYKPEQVIRDEYAQIQKEFLAGDLPPEVIDELQEVLEEVGKSPLVVRSSSQLEDNLGTVFAGKYDSFFCPNQGTDQERMHDLVDAIKKVYASTLKPEALLYRRSQGLEDYDERMAVLIQTIQGEQFGDYYMPQIAGVAFSRNLYRWSPSIKPEEGFARLVWGLGTRAVDRFENDYPRIVALSHPHLHPNDSAKTIHYYSQQNVDLIDLKSNAFKSLPVHNALKPQYSPLPYIAQINEGDYLRPIRMRISPENVSKLVITYDGLLKRTPFVHLLKKMLRLIEEHYHKAVDIEFVGQLTNLDSYDPGIKISLLQCRPQPHLHDSFEVSLPKDIPDEDVIFSTSFMVPRGFVKDIRYVLFVHPTEYFSLETMSERTEISQIISKINAQMSDNSFICVGPGRWGSINSDLGVGSSYSDIYHAAALVEVSGEGIGNAPEPSLGTHFFQDLMEAQIYPLAIYLDNEDAIFNQNFFYNSPNCLKSYVEASEKMCQCIRLIDINEIRPNHHLEIVMDDERSQALAYLVQTH